MRVHSRASRTNQAFAASSLVNHPVNLYRNDPCREEMVCLKARDASPIELLWFSQVCLASVFRSRSTRLVPICENIWNTVGQSREKNAQ